MSRRLMIFSFFIILIADTSYSQNSIKFVVPDFPPYTYMEKDVIKGKGVDIVDKIMKKAKLPYSLTFVPNYGRALAETINGKADGFFLASQNKERDEVAFFSKKIMINRWSWFIIKGSKIVPTDPHFKKEAKTGTHLNTNTHKWLMDNKYQVIATPNDVDQLPEILVAGRIDAVFLAEDVFIEAVLKSGRKMENFVQYVQEEKPMGIYLSKIFLKSNPGVMDKINQAIAELGIK